MGIRIASILLLLGAAAPALAQEGGQERDPTIVVTGRQPMTEEQTREAVRRTARPVDGQLARFSEPICPRVTGFETRYEAIVAARIKATARAIGADAGREGCVANLYVVIVDDGREFVREMRRQHPGVFAGLSKREFTELESSAGAARSWTSTVLTNSNGAVAGTPSQGDRNTLASLNGPNLSITSDAKIMVVQQGSNMHPSVQQAIASAWIVIETGATFGKSLTQLADYSAMRGLAMVRPAELAGSTETILALFEPGLEAETAPPELTAFDRAYLKSLYRGPARRWARSQVRYIADAITRESERDSP